MTKEQVYDIWAPLNSPWTRWVKPVLFSFMNAEEIGMRQHSSCSWNIATRPGTALVVECPGAESVVVGIECAKAGYQPVPLYNACPHATAAIDDDLITSLLKPKTIQVVPVVDVTLIMQALWQEAEILSQTQLPPNAAPAFLLDADRRGYTLVPNLGSFDNRSVVSKTDFPSGRVLQQNGIKEVILIKKGVIQPDLLHVLFAWQAEGITIAQQLPWSIWLPQKIKVQKPSLLVYAWQRLLLAFGYRRNEFGAFGRIIRSSLG